MNGEQMLSPVSVEYVDKGLCYMHIGDNGGYGVETTADSYCPDYWNRKKGDKEDCTLDEWLNHNGLAWSLQYE